ncbi:MAG: S1 RNA-binding domain-containing protein [Clostridia bacterium]|nr:S1 RNA-binding domain-containing protein [Clostridia bacterium]
MQVEIGAVVDGKVTGIKAFGAFVKLPTGETGMVHISEVASAYVNDINEFLTVGQDVKVKVLGENDKGKISLSIKQAAPKEPSAAPVRGNNSRRGHRNAHPPVWQGVKQTDSSNMSFEDMLAAFKKTSEEKMSELKRGSEVRSSRRGNGNRG